MNHREFFDHHAENWDEETNGKILLSKLNRIIEIAGIQTDDAILDLGSGTGILLTLLKDSTGNKGRVVALDLSFKMLKKAKSKNGNLAVYVQADVNRLPLKEMVFNRVVCLSAFPHFPDKKEALSEIFRMLKRNGKLVITHLASREAINAFHKRVGGVVKRDQLPDSMEMVKLFKKVGFSHIEIINEEDFYSASGTKL